MKIHVSCRIAACAADFEQTTHTDLVVVADVLHASQRAEGRFSPVIRGGVATHLRHRYSALICGSVASRSSGAGG